MEPSQQEPRFVTVRAIPESEKKRPLWPVTEAAEAAVRSLEEGKLLQLMLHYTEEEIQFHCSHKNVDPDSVGSYFESPVANVYSFYRYPGTNSVVLLWTPHPGLMSTKRMAAQRGVRRDMIAIAQQQGIEITREIKVQSSGDINAERLREQSP